MDINNPIFQNEDSAREYLEAVRWPEGPFCPHCGEAENVMKLEGTSHRKGLHQCRSCREQFTVTVGTLFERSKIKLNKWLLATYLLSSSKKGISTHQLHRMLGITYKSAWFMTHRIRESMRQKSDGQMGGEGSTVEVDETFWGNTKRRGQKKGRGYHHKEKVLTLVERGGKARSFHVPAVNAKTLRPILREQIDADTHIMTDEAAQYVHPRNQYSEAKSNLVEDFQKHDYVNHGIGEYVRGDIHTNIVEGYFSVLKRGLTGTYQHVSKKHLKRYLGEFDFRYNNRTVLGVSDMERTNEALKGIEGKRLTYRRTDSGALCL